MVSPGPGGRNWNSVLGRFRERKSSWNKDFISLRAIPPRMHCSDFFLAHKMMFVPRRDPLSKRWRLTVLWVMRGWVADYASSGRAKATWAGGISRPRPPLSQTGRFFTATSAKPLAMLAAKAKQIWSSIVPSGWILRTLLHGFIPLSKRSRRTV